MLHAQPRRRLVDEVDRLVGELPTGDVAVGERRGGDQRGVGDAYAVVCLVLLLDPTEDLDGVLDTGLADEDLLEAALQGGVLLDPLAVLVQRGRADHVQLTARQHRLEHVARVHRRVATGARTDDRVQLVDERDDLSAGVLDLLEHGLEPLLELAAVLRSGHHRGEVERQHPAALERVGHVAGDHALREPLDDGGLADAGLADEDGIVLGAPREHLDHAPDLGVAADDRVETAVLGGLREVDGVLLQRLVRRLGGLAGDASVAADGGDRLAQPGGREAGVGEHLLGGRLDRGDRHEEVVGRDVLVLHRAGQVERLGQHARQCSRPAGLLHRGAGGAGQRLLRGLGPSEQGLGVHACLHHQAAARPVLLPKQCNQQVDGLGVGVAARRGSQLGSLDDLSAAAGELLCTELTQLCSSVGVRWSRRVAWRPSRDPGPLWSHLVQHATS